MSLLELDNEFTDKNTTHSYLNTYEKLFSKKKISATSILEIGVLFGGSIKMWHEYFPNAQIYGFDINGEKYIIPDIKNQDRIKLYLNNDAYIFDFDNKDIKFDIIIDDGPHTIVSQILCIEKYLELLTEDGILIIEDVQDINHIEILKKIVPEEYQKYIEIYDLRNIKDRYDDILFVINKNKLNIYSIINSI